MDRTDDIVIPPRTAWLRDDAAQAVCRVVMEAGHRIYFVGGCVRNALLGLPDSDIDLSTDARPEQVMEIARVAGLKAIPTGIDHGTVTVVADSQPFEITTFRRDVETDGRRAVVTFSDSIEEDARRRDFTMNALYALPDGRVIDPLDGLPDLHARRIRFIEDADARIREDYLRTLRFFRFFAWYADEAQGFEPDTLNAITRNLDGLGTLSAERLGQEMRKLLSAPAPGAALAGMRSTGVLNAVLPGADDRMIGPIVHFEETLGTAPDWLCRLVALGGEAVEDRLRLSRSEAKQYQLIRQGQETMQPLPEIAYRQGARTAQAVAFLRAAMVETPPHVSVMKDIAEASHAEFPLKAKDLMPIYEGPALGQKLAELEQLWIMSNFTMKKTELLKHG